MVSVSEKLGQLLVQVDLTNVGKRPGKEVLQVYGMAPQGKLGKSKRHLLVFEKSRLLQPGETQRLRLAWKMEDMASYDDLGKVKKSAYVLEQGDYFFYLGNSVENVEKLDHTYSQTQDQVVLQCQPKLVPASLKERMLADGTMEPLPQLPARNPKECGLPYLSKEPLDGLKPATRAVPGTYCWGEDLYKKGVRPFSEVAEGRMTG